ncbi:MAG: hypothetical protein WC969_15335 [Elusimicrobiota bacterium]|jgi:hypothetical protein
MAVFRFGAVLTQTVRLTGISVKDGKFTILAQVKKADDASFELTREEAESIHRNLGELLGKPKT